MNILICTRDLDYGVGSVVKFEIENLSSNKKIKKIIVIGPKKLGGFNKKVRFEVLKSFGKYFITKQPYFAFACNKKIKKIILNEKIDKIITHFPILACNYETNLYSKFHYLNSSMISFSLNPLKIIENLFHYIYSYFDFITIKNSKKIYFVSKRTMKEASEAYPEYKNRFVYQKNKVDPHLFFKVKKEYRKKIKNDFLFNDEKKNILFVGRIEQMKGINELIKAIADLNLNIRLIVAGDGPLKKEIMKYPFVKYVGQIKRKYLFKYYNIADLVILPSHYENSPLVILEAKKCGAPILATNVGDNSLLLDNKDDLFEKGDISSLKEKIRTKLGFT